MNADKALRHERVLEHRRRSYRGAFICEAPVTNTLPPVIRIEFTDSGKNISFRKADFFVCRHCRGQKNYNNANRFILLNVPTKTEKIKQKLK